MTRDALPPLPDDVVAMLAEDRRAPEPPTAIREQVFAQVLASLGGAHGAAAPASLPAAPTGALRWPLWSRGLAVVAMAVGVTVVGAWFREQKRPTAVAHAHVVAPGPADPLAIVSNLELTRVAPQSLGSGESVPVASTRLPATAWHTGQRTVATRDPEAAESVDELTAERELLDVARAALARRAGRDAIAALDRHLGRFPHGALSEEREGMWIAALAILGDRVAAEARAERFQRRFPGSVLAPVVSAALHGDP